MTRAIVLAAVLGALGCTATIPEGQLECSGAGDCPTGWSCAGSRCYSHAIDAGQQLDAGHDLDAGHVLDAGHADGGALDAGPDSGARDAGTRDAGGRDSAVLDGGPAEELASIVAGDAHSCALTTAGRTLCWGSNAFGQLGDGSSTSRTTAVELAGSPPAFVELAAGGRHTCGRSDGGEVWCWGDNQLGQIGVPAGGRSYQTPVRVMMGGAIAIACGEAHTCALLSTGGVACWGKNNVGQLADGTRTNRTVPTPVMDLPPGTITAIAAGNAHVCIALEEGEVWCWGWNSHGQLGSASASTGDFQSTTAPVRVDGLAGATALAGGAEFTCAITDGGDADAGVAAESVVCWGKNADAQLGAPGAERPTPGSPVELTHPATVIAAGDEHACALGGALVPTCWGKDYSGQVGDGRGGWLTDAPPSAVSFVFGAVRAIAGGAAHTCAVEAERALCWGANDMGQLGNASTTTSYVPVEVDGITLAR